MAIEAAGGTPVMWRTGHSLIKDKMKALRAPIAGEMSGHMFFTEGFYGHDDALYGAARLLRIVAAAGIPLASMLADVPAFVSTPEIRADCPDDRKFAVVDAAAAHFKRSHDVIDVDGVRVLFGDGWGLFARRIPSRSLCCASRRRRTIDWQVFGPRWKRGSRHRASVPDHGGPLRRGRSGHRPAHAIVRPMTRRRMAVLFVFGAAAVLLLGRIVSGLFIDYQWFAHMHASSVWTAEVVNRLLLTGSIAAVTTAFVFANLYAVRRSIVTVVLPRRLANVEIGEELPGRFLTTVTAIVAVVLGLLLALPPEPWMELAAVRYGRPFGVTDPYFDLDLGFYVYWLPLENALYVRTLLVLVGTIFVVAVLYVVVTPNLRWDRNRFRLTAHVRRHLAALTPLFFGVVSWNYRLDAYAVLSHGSGPGGLFTHADHHFVIPAERLLAVVLLAAGVVTALALWRNQIKTALIFVTASLLLLGAYHFTASLIEHGTAGPDSAARDQDYLVVRRQATRTAYGTNRLVTVPTREAPIEFASLGEAASRISIGTPRRSPRR